MPSSNPEGCVAQAAPYATRSPSYLLPMLLHPAHIRAHARVLPHVACCFVICLLADVSGCLSITSGVRRACPIVSTHSINEVK
jgi:hypothetical protein